MAGQGRTASDAVALSRALQDEPYRFDFFQAVRRLEAVYRDSPRVGLSRRPGDDPFRFGQEPTLAFAPSTLAAFRPGKEGRPSKLAVYFFGLFGPNGPLPLHLTEHARDRRRNHKDTTFEAFADLFHHRMLSLFYRGWSSAQPAVSFDRPEEDRFALFVGALFGLALPSQRNRDALPDRAKLHHAGRLSCRTAHAEGLRAMLADYFCVSVEISQFVGEWLEIPEAARWRLGESAATGGLGTTATVGARVWSCQHKFRLRLGPLTYADYHRLLPGSPSLERLAALVQNYTGAELAWDAQLILAEDEVPRLQLGGGERLGLTTWLIGDRARRDADDLILNPLAAAAANQPVGEPS